MTEPHSGSFARILLSVTSGDSTTTFLRLLKPLQPALERYARRLLRNESQIEDVLQESVLAAFERFDDFAPGTNFKAWMFRFVTFRALTANRRVEPVKLDEIPGELAADECWDSIEAERVFERILRDPDIQTDLFESPLNRALKRLAAPERACLLLRAVGEFTYQEIHEQLDMPLGSVMGYLSRARKRLRHFLAEFAAEHSLRSNRSIPTNTETNTVDAKIQ